MEYSDPGFPVVDSFIQHRKQEPCNAITNIKTNKYEYTKVAVMNLTASCRAENKEPGNKQSKVQNDK